MVGLNFYDGIQYKMAVNFVFTHLILLYNKTIFMDEISIKWN